MSYTFSASTTDPDGDSLKYAFDWGDGTSSSTRCLESGCVVSLGHSWSRPGSYTIRVMATDVKGASSGWSQPASFYVNIRVFKVGFTSNVDNVSMFVDRASFILSVAFKWTEGSIHEVSAEDKYNFTDGGRLLFAGWDDGFKEKARFITASSSRVFKAIYETQYLLQASLYPGVRYSKWCSAREMVQLTVNSTVILQGDDTRLVFAGWSNEEDAQTLNLTVNGPLSIEAMWKRQFLLRVKSDYGEAGGGGWYDEFPGARIFVSPKIFDCGNGTRRVFDLWKGEGLGSYTGNDLNATVCLEAPVKETAFWKTQYMVKIESAYGNPIGEGWYDALSEAKISLEPVIYESPTMRLIFLRWDGDICDHNVSLSVVVNSPIILRAVWVREFYLNVASTCGDTWGSGWYADGTVASFGVSPLRPSLIANVFEGLGWRYHSNTLNATVTIDSPKNVVARWRSDYLMVAAFFAFSVVIVGALIHFGHSLFKYFKKRISILV